MLSEFREKKLKHMYTLMDSDHNGYVEEANYLRYISNLATIMGWNPTDALYVKLKNVYLASWEGIRQMADANRDNRITWDEYRQWFLAVEEQMRSGGLIEAFAGAVFDISDLDGDGVISLAEHKASLEAQGITTDAAANFKALDLNGDGHISRQEAIQLVHDFFLSEDPQAPGNRILGPL